MTEALSHLRVVDLSDDIPAAFCARQFAAWGAEVVAVEPESGSRLRTLEPSVRAENGAEIAPLWEFLAADKRLLRGLDPATLARLVAGADVLVTDWSAERLAAAGLDAETLERVAPRLVTVALSPYGSEGPLADAPGTDLTVQARSGLINMNGLPGRPPLKGPANVLAYAAGAGAFVGALAALYERGTSGRGQRVEVAALDVVATTVAILRVQYTGIGQQRQGGPGAFTSLYPCKDGYVAFTTTSPGLWEHLLETLGVPEGAVPEELRTPEGRTNRDAVRAFLAEWTPKHEAETLFAAIGGVGERCGIVNSPRQLIDNPHLRARGFFFKVQHPAAGPLVFTGPPVRMSETPMAAPVVAHEDAAPNWSQAAAETRDEGEASTLPPLHGVRIVDLTQAWVGPYATQLLADLGADVVKVESHRRPDVWRGAQYGVTEVPPGAAPGAHPWNTATSFNMVNRNKRDLALDLDFPEGKALLLRLIERADVLVENYTPRVMPNFGMDYARLRQVKPDLVMASFSGYGADGPYRDLKANGATTEATSGWDALLGYPGGLPLALGGMQADAITGLQLAASTLVALLHRQRTGQGQWIEGSMFEAAVGYIGEQVLAASVTGATPERQGNRHPRMAPHDAYPCAGADDWIAIAVRDDADWARLLKVAGDAPALQDAAFATATGRLAAVDALDAALSVWTRQHDKHELASRLQAAGAPAAPVQRDAELLRDTQLTARDWFLAMTHPDMGTQLHHGHIWRFSRTWPVVKTPSPRLGEHSEAVLAEELELSAAEIARLQEQGVTGAVLRRDAQTIGVR